MEIFWYTAGIKNAEVFVYILMNTVIRNQKSEYAKKIIKIIKKTGENINSKNFINTCGCYMSVKYNNNQNSYISGEYIKIFLAENKSDQVKLWFRYKGVLHYISLHYSTFVLNRTSPNDLKTYPPQIFLRDGEKTYIAREDGTERKGFYIICSKDKDAEMSAKDIYSKNAHILERNLGELESIISVGRGYKKLKNFDKYLQFAREVAFHNFF